MGAAIALLTLVLAAGLGQPDSAEPSAELVGIWAADLSHAGSSTQFALHLEAGENGKLLIKMSAPVIHVIESPIGRVAPQIRGDEVVLGPFTLTYDRDAGTLSGVMPEGLVPVHRVPLLLRRVGRFEAPARPDLTAPKAQPAWTFESGSPLWPGATFAADTVYAGGDDGALHAVEARTGKRRWVFQAGGAIRTRATVAGQDLYFQADDGFLYKLSAATGEERFRVKICEKPIARLPFDDPKSRYDRYGSDVTVAGGRLYVGTHDGRMLALDPTTGATLWGFAAGDSILAASAVVKGRVYFGSFDHHVYALDAAKGELVWKQDTRAPVVSTPAIDGRLLVVGSRSYDLLGLDVKTGKATWTDYFWFSWVESSATIRDRVAYVGSSDAAALFAVDARNGRRIWSTDVHGWAWGQPAVTVNRVYIGTVGTSGYLASHFGCALAIDRASGRPVWQYPAAAADRKQFGFAGSPAVGAGLVFFTGLDGRIYAFDE